MNNLFTQSANQSLPIILSWCFVRTKKPKNYLVKGSGSETGTGEKELAGVSLKYSFQLRLGIVPRADFPVRNAMLADSKVCHSRWTCRMSPLAVVCFDI